jgi:Family of unknown function (DUF5906)/Domain of unknown function (DUF3854)
MASKKSTPKNVDPFAHEAHELALAKLASSGLGAQDMATLRMEALTPTQTHGLHDSFKPLCALKITYWDPQDLDKPLAARPKWPSFYRLRYLRPNGDAKDVRYTNEPGAGVVAYFPPSIDWPTIIKDPEQTLLITEGELKAAKACAMGNPCIGLGGVWNFRSSQMGITFLPELEAVNWLRRRVYIVYDSDVIVKPGVQDALNAMAEELMARGALAFMVLVPEGDGGKKQGLDDWCVANPGLDVYDLCARHQPLTQVRKLFELNDKLCYVMDKGIVVDQATGNKMAATQFKEAYQNIDYAELMVNDQGSVSLKKAPIATNWLKWPMRKQVSSMTYAPGADKIICPDDADRSQFNLWPGWGVEPEKGDIQPFLDLLNHLFKGSDKEDKTWFLRWMAYPLQYPGTKLFTAAVIHGVKHGTGKSLIGYTLAKIYGKNFTEINQNHLHAGFNGWAEAKQLVMGDDVTGSNKRQDNDLLKKLITQRELRVNTKFMPEYVVPDCVNYLFTSNHPDAFFLENDDRRFFIHEVLVPPLDEAFYMEYVLWLDTTGPAALFDYLLKLDLADFNPSAPARRTVAKEQMTADTRSDIGDWVHKLRFDPDSILKVGEAVVPGDLFTAQELLVLYDPMGTKRVTANGLARELRRAAVPRANRGVAFKGPKGTDRYYIIRNVDQWIDAPVPKLVAFLEKGPEMQPKKRKY